MTLLLVLAAVALVAAALLLYGSRRNQAMTAMLGRRLEDARRSVGAERVDLPAVASLPPPVGRYLRAVLSDGRPRIAGAVLSHAGSFNLSATGERWKPFTSTQRVATWRPGFDWEARIRMFPGGTIRVHDAYVAGEGLLHASLFGLVRLAGQRGGGDIARAELLRFLAESPWYPTVLLSGQGVTWTAVDAESADATITDGAVTATLRFRFDADGLVVGVRAEARDRTVGGTTVPTPWEGRWSHYEERDGLRVPTEGEVAWVLPEGPRPYWRGRLVAARYTFTS